MKGLIILFVSLSSILYAQSSVSGRVIDAETQLPVPFATVYVDGTTNGTITNTDGLFELKRIMPPYQLVVSHVSYQTKVKLAQGGSGSIIHFSLEKKNNVIKEFKMEDKNHRQHNVNRFVWQFVGVDSWGMSAVLQNDSALSFSTTMVDGETIRCPVRRNSDSTHLVTFKHETEFKAYASSPLVIEMPLLGYTLHADLVDFSLASFQGVKMGTSLAYYYYKPYQIDNKRKTKKVMAYRKVAFYNSSSHFCRSLFSKSLLQNGYVLYDVESQEDVKNEDVTQVNIDSCLVPIGDRQMAIVGMKGRRLVILYFHKNDGSPRNLVTQRNGHRYVQSGIYFMSDTCVFAKNGIVPNNSILFNGAISKKGVGASLPANFDITAE